MAIAVAGALVSMIVSLGKVSGGHLNPLITVIQTVAGERQAGCALAYVFAQWLGGVAGGALAALLGPDVPAASVGLGWNGFASEFTASAGSMLVVLGATLN